MLDDNEILDLIQTIGIENKNKVSLYLIKRSQSENEDKKFDLRAITLEGEPVDSFQSIIQKKLSYIEKGIEEDEITITGFYDEAIKPDDLSQLDSNVIPGFDSMISKMKSFDLVTYLKNLSGREKFDFYACEFIIGEERVVFFRKTSYKKLLQKDKKLLRFKFLDGVFSKIEGDIFTFDEGVDCIYIDSKKLLLVIDKFATEDMFNFKEYYYKYAKSKLTNLQTRGLIKVDMKKLNLENKLLVCKRITSIDKNNRFNKKIEDYKKCDVIFKEHKGEFKENITNLDIQDDKVIIDSDEKLETFVHLSNQDIVRDIIEEEWFVSLKKESLKK